MIEKVAFLVVALTGVYFIAFAVASLFASAQTARFLLGFASTPALHYLELSLRFMIGGSLAVSSPKMFASTAMNIFGWILLITTICILFLPWRWHWRFAQKVVPRATHYMTAIGLCSLPLGVFILTALIRGSSA